MMCTNKARYEIIWGPKVGQSKFSCLEHINKQINTRAVVNTILLLEEDHSCQFVDDSLPQVSGAGRCL